MTILAVDYGRRFLGLAVCSDSEVVLPLKALEMSSPNQALAGVVKICREHRAGVVVLGLPCRRDGPESGLSGEIRALGGQLKKSLPEIKVDFADESLTSFAVGGKLTHLKRSKKRAVENSLSAVLILENYLLSPLSGQPPNEGQS